MEDARLPMARSCWAAVVASALVQAGCFDPTFEAGIECGAGESCPAGLVCGEDEVCRDPADLPPDGAAASDRDAAPPADGAAAADADVASDAAEVACQGDRDCEEPPSPCLEAGTCAMDTGTCDFPAVDCAHLDSACQRGECRESDGVCVGVPTAEGEPCEEPTTECGECSFDSVCAEEATRTCAETTFACSDGSCEPSEEEFEERGCDVRDTDGDPCGSEGPPEECSPSCPPDENCVQNCTCYTPTCSGGSCSEEVGSPCTRCCQEEPCNELCV